MEFDEYEPGVPSWVDLASPDVLGAVGFYTGLFGWAADAGPPEAGGYRVCSLRGRAVAGIGPLQAPGTTPAWTTYVNTDDADGAAARVVAAGGTVVVAPRDVLQAGRTACFADPAGAVFGVWQPAGHRGAGLANEDGTYCWSELLTTDVAGAPDFYGEVFGWKARTSPMDGGGRYTEWLVGGRAVAGMMAKPPSMPADAPPVWSVYFAVADCDEAAGRVRSLGGSVVLGPQDIGPGRFAVARDPQGATFDVVAFAAVPGPGG